MLRTSSTSHERCMLAPGCRSNSDGAQSTHLECWADLCTQPEQHRLEPQVWIVLDTAVGLLPQLVVTLMLNTLLGNPAKCWPGLGLQPASMQCVIALDAPLYHTLAGVGLKKRRPSTLLRTSALRGAGAPYCLVCFAAARQWDKWAIR